MSKIRHYKKPLIFLGLLALLLVATIPFWKKRTVEVPIYQGRPLTYWADQHPTNYYEACRALGTNALPYLLSELEAQDSFPAVLLQKLASSLISTGDVFVHARNRRYYALLGLQQLDTNAVPPLLDRFIALASGDSPDRDFVFSSVNNALSSLVSSNAQSMKLERFSELLSSDNARDKSAACLGLAWTLPPSYSTNLAARIVPLAKNSDSHLRQSVMIFVNYHHLSDDLALPVMFHSLSDSNTSVRQLAFNALFYRRTNVTSSIPALLNLYSNPPAHLVSDQNFRSQLRQGIRQIDPTQVPP